ncbi:hypothetical protein [Romboutsia lituseburensis]|uniref:hypothetical protein n=1 Tax=Romboutsia lituseburensis TaxID=1537 RepID=UPI00215B05D3|nr:hypothetical protein [Romboutsia lituseburensis]MCR8746990.1 hypothetical protein [Romboutsia lituseburensis]
MKRIILLVTSIAIIFLVGCSQSRAEKAESLKDAYFKIVEKNLKNEEIDNKYLKQLLQGYEYTKDKAFRMEGENIDGSDYVQQPYVFINRNEKLVIIHSNFNNKEQIQPLYSIKKNNNEVTISYQDRESELKNKENSSKDDFMFTLISDNIKTHQYISNKLQHDKGKWDKIYNKIANNIAKNNSIDIVEISSLIGDKASSQEYQESLNSPINLNIKEYIFENNDETLMVKYLKDKNKILEVFYNDKESGTIKTTMDKHLLNEQEKLHTGIITYINNKEFQKELFNDSIK